MRLFASALVVLAAVWGGYVGYESGLRDAKVQVEYRFLPAEVCGGGGTPVLPVMPQ